jgi:putative transposase
LPRIAIEREDDLNRTSYLQLYVHLVWATWDRLPLITEEIEKFLHVALVAKATELGCKTVAVGGIEDHVHHLVWLPSTVPVARLAKELKGESAHLVNRRKARTFRWQAGYGGFTVARTDLTRVANYVHNQRSHHKSNRLSEHLELVHDSEDGQRRRL